MDQDDLEEKLFAESFVSHLNMINTSATKFLQWESMAEFLGRPEVVVGLLASMFALIWYLEVNRVFYLKIPKFVFQWFQSALEGSTLEHSDGFAHVYGIQGRRPNMEDRFISVEVRVDDLDPNLRPVRINGVLDGHGGKFAPVFVKRYLLDSLPRKVKLLKILSHKTMQKEEKISRFELYNSQKSMPKSVLNFLKISEEEYKEINPHGNVLNDLKASSNHDDNNKGNRSNKKGQQKKSSSTNMLKDLQDEKKNFNKSLVSTERSKPLEESTTSLSSSTLVRTTKTAEIQSILTLNPKALVLKKSKSTSNNINNNNKNKKSSNNSSSLPQHENIVDFLSCNGDILYSHLIRHVITEVDKALLERAKRNGQLGGTTLLLTILDQDLLWVANVGDSRGIMICSNSDKVTPLSYDHKPCQLKEKRRIEEAGGFVAHNGVWRVQGILATSRALGDYPLKDQGFLTCEPDVLSFNLNEAGGAEVALLATDGLWDTMSNENAGMIFRNLRRQDKHNLFKVAKKLTQAAFAKESTDNVTVMLLDLKNRVKKKLEPCDTTAD